MPLFGYYGFDMYYLVLVLPIIIVSLVIQHRMKTTYAEFSAVRNSRGLTGAQAAALILQYYNVSDVQIVQIQGKLTDCFDPTQNVIKLSPEVYSGVSIAAVGVACHEAGHAAQHAEGYVPIKIRNAILPVCNIGSTLFIPLLIIGIILSFSPLIWIGIGFFAFTALFQFATLPVEFNASSRALKVIDAMGILTYEEKLGAARVLRAAAMTYVAAFAVSLAQLLRLLLRFGNRR